jgi:hypothetical protein
MTSFKSSTYYLSTTFSWKTDPSNSDLVNNIVSRIQLYADTNKTTTDGAAVAFDSTLIKVTGFPLYLIYLITVKVLFRFDLILNSFLTLFRYNKQCYLYFDL